MRFSWLAGFNYLDSRLVFSQDFDHHAGGPNPNARRAERAEVETQSLSSSPARIGGWRTR